MGPSDTESEVLRLLTTASPSERLSAARVLKHSIVGNNACKRRYLARGASQVFVSLLNDERTSADLAAECAAVLSVLAGVSEESAKHVVSLGVVPSLFQMLQNPGSGRLNAARTLDVLHRYGPAGLSGLEEKRVLVGLAKLLDSDETAVISMKYLATICDGPEIAEKMTIMGLPLALIDLFKTAKSKETSQGALKLLGVICELSRDAGRWAVEANMIPLVERLVRHGNPSERMAGVAFMVALFVSRWIDGRFLKPLIIILFDLLAERDTDIDLQATKALVRLVDVNEDCRRVALDCCAGCDLAVLLERSNEETQVYVIHLIAKLAADCEEMRISMSDLVVLRHMHKALTSGNRDIIIVTALCIQSLTRSPTFLRDKREVKPMVNQLLDQILGELLSLAIKSDKEVQHYCLRALCNVVLASPRKMFDPSREAVLQSVVSLTSWPDEEIRYCAVYCLKNMFSKLKLEELASTQQLFARCNLKSLCNDSSRRIRTQAFALIRNLSCALSDSRQYQCVQHLLNSLGDNLFRTLERELSSEGGDETVLQVLHVLCNIAASDEKHKNLLLEKKDLMDGIMQQYHHKWPCIRVAAVRVIMNLAWRKDSCKKSSSVLQDNCDQESGPLGRLLNQPRNNNDLGVPDNREAQFDRKQRSDKELKEPVVSNDPEERNMCLTPKSGENTQNDSCCDDPRETRFRRLAELGVGDTFGTLKDDPHVEVRIRCSELFDLLSALNS